MLVSAHINRRAVREPGASPGRSRRCKGRCLPADTPLARGPGRRRGGEPRVRRPAARRQTSNPSRKEDSCSTPSVVPAGALVAALPPCCALDRARGHAVQVRVEGKASRRSSAPPSRVLERRRTRSAALEAASLAGEFYYHVTSTAFGPYVDQIGRYPAAATSGWVFKVNGVSPPVGADKVRAEGRRRASSGTGRRSAPPAARRRCGSYGEARRNCYRVIAQDDTGARPSRHRRRAPRRRPARADAGGRRCASGRHAASSARRSPGRRALERADVAARGAPPRRPLRRRRAGGPVCSSPPAAARTSGRRDRQLWITRDRGARGAPRPVRACGADGARGARPRGGRRDALRRPLRPVDRGVAEGAGARRDWF